MITAIGTVLRIVAARTNEPFCVKIISEKSVVACSWRVTDSNGAECASGVAKSAEFVGKFDAEPWSIASPKLYTLNVEIEYEDGTREELSDRFGFRYVTAEGKNFYLNGYPFYMRGYIRGCAAHEHQNNCALSEYEFYRKTSLWRKATDITP